jgi:hypothetical protein
MVCYKVRENWFLVGDGYTDSRQEHKLLLKSYVWGTLHLERAQLDFPLRPKTNLWLTRNFWGQWTAFSSIMSAVWSSRSFLFIIIFLLLIIIVSHSTIRNWSSLSSTFVTFQINSNSRSVKIAPSLPVTLCSRGLLGKLTVTHLSIKSTSFYGIQNFIAVFT